MAVATTSTDPHRLLEESDQLRIKAIVIACLVSAVVITGLVTWMMAMLSDDGSFVVCLGVGAMIGFWMCPFAGSVIGNGWYESRKDRAIERLKPKEREAVLLSVYQGMSHSEISSHMDVPLGTVKTYIRRGLGRVREMLVGGAPLEGMA